jgi:uncharacterized membrane protein
MTFGPVQMLIVEFDSAALKGQILPELARLRQAGLIRLIDLLVVTKDHDGDVTAVEATDLDVEEAEEFGAIAGALIGLGAGGEPGAEIGAAAGAQLAADGSILDGQVWFVADAIPAGVTAAVALIEHLWAAPLRDAINGAGGLTLADEWIHPEDLVAIGIAASEDS